MFAKVDVLHAPCLPIPTPTIAETDIGGSPAMDRTLMLLTKFMRPFNYLGLPSLALPCGFLASGLPVGMQLVGRPFAEDLILPRRARVPARDRVAPARACEALLDASRSSPSAT